MKSAVLNNSNQHNTVISGKPDAYINRIFTRFIIVDIIAWGVNFLSYFIDCILGGVFKGEAALAAIEAVAPIVTAIHFVESFISRGSVCLHLALVGKNDKKESNLVFSTCFYASIVLGVVTSVALFFLRDPILSLYNLQDEILTYAKEYYTPYIFYALFSPFLKFIYYSVRSEGAIHLSIICDVLYTVLNLILSYVLLNRIGVMGLSIASTILCFTINLIPCLHFFTKKNTFRLIPSFSWKAIFESILHGIHIWFSIISKAVVELILNVFIYKYFGALYAGPFAIIRAFIEVGFATEFVGDELEVLLTIASAENNLADSKVILKIAKKFAIFVPLGFSVITLCLMPALPYIFGLKSQEFIQYAYWIDGTISLSFLFTSFLFLFSYYLNTYDKNFQALLVESGYYIVADIFFPVILGVLCGYIGFIIGFAVAPVVTCLLIYLVYYLKQGKKVFILPTDDNDIYTFDLTLDKQSFYQLLRELHTMLVQKELDCRTRNHLELTLEESINVLLDKNKNRKFKTHLRIILRFEQNKIVVYEKDDGPIFNLSDDDQKIDSLSNFVLTGVLSSASYKGNYIALSGNANRFIFNIDR